MTGMPIYLSHFSFLCKVLLSVFQYLLLFCSVVCVGGDGTVHKVMNALINKTQKEENLEIRPNFSPARPKQPLGIIPTGKTTFSLILIALKVVLNDLFLLARNIRLYL